MQQRSSNNNNQQQQQAPQFKIALPSELPPGSRDRAEAISQLRRMKIHIKYSDLYCDDSGAFFCHVTLHKNMVEYLPRTALCNRANVKVPLTEDQARELGIEFKPSGCFKHVNTNSFVEPHVLLFRAEQADFFAARQRQLQQRQSSSVKHHVQNDQPVHENSSIDSPPSSLIFHSSPSALSCVDAARNAMEDDAHAWIVDKREHIFNAGN